MEGCSDLYVSPERPLERSQGPDGEEEGAWWFETQQSQTRGWQQDPGETKAQRSCRVWAVAAPAPGKGEVEAPMCFTAHASAVLGHRLVLFSSESTETVSRMNSCVRPEVIYSTDKRDSLLPTPCSADTWGEEFLPKTGEKACIDTEECSARAPMSCVELWVGFSYQFAAFPLFHFPLFCMAALIT